MSRTPCALCHTREPEAFVRYRPELKKPSGPFKQDSTPARDEMIEIPVCNRCKQRSSRLHAVSRSLGCIGLLGLLVGMIGLTVATFSDSSSLGLVSLLPVGSGAVGLGLIVLVGPARWVLQHWEQRQISHWLQIHRPTLWREINSMPSAEDPV